MYVVRRSHNRIGDPCFMSSGPRSVDSVSMTVISLKQLLKAYLFGVWDTVPCDGFVRECHLEIILLAYLLIFLCL